MTTWHSAKMAWIDLFQNYVWKFWLPFLKVLQPNSTYIIVLKLYTIVNFFYIISLAWKEVRP